MASQIHRALVRVQISTCVLGFKRLRVSCFLVGSFTLPHLRDYCVRALQFESFTGKSQVVAECCFLDSEEL